MTKQDYTPEWANIEPKYKYVAVDEDGGVFKFARKPEQFEGVHIIGEGDHILAIRIDRIDPPGENWKTMIYERPEGQ